MFWSGGDTVADMSSNFYFFAGRYLEDPPGDKFLKFSMDRLVELLYNHQYSRGDRRFDVFDSPFRGPFLIDSTPKWELEIRYLENLYRWRPIDVPVFISECHEVYEDIAPRLERSDLMAFKESFLRHAAETAGRMNAGPIYQCGIHGMTPEALDSKSCHHLRAQSQARQTWLSRMKSTPAGCFRHDLLDTDCWLEILKLLDTKDRANVKMASTYMYNLINATTIYYDFSKSAIFTRSLCRPGDIGKIQEVSVTTDTMKAQPTWHIEMRGTRNFTYPNYSNPQGIDLIKGMASLSHPRRVISISTDSVADVQLMMLVWDGFLKEFCNLQYLTIVRCSIPPPDKAFETHKALHGLSYEVDVIGKAVVERTLGTTLVDNALVR